jgi:S1-C subfamily serine protease
VSTALLVPNTPDLQLGNTMKQQLRHWIWCVACTSCAHGSPVGSVTPTNQVTERAAAGAASSTVTGYAGPMATERLILALVERALSKATAPHPSRSVPEPKATKRPQKPSAHSESLYPERRQQVGQQQLAASDRTETLKVTGSSGDFCAAVSIASQLAVTALHCVQSLCESAQFPMRSTLLGCRVSYEIPNGTSGEATVVATSENDLLALIDLHHSLPKHGVLRCDDPRVDDRVYTVGHPNGDNWLVSYGWLTREPISLEWVDGEATRVLVAQIPTKRGSSGGGLFDVHDRVVGVQIARWSSWSSDYGKAAFIQASRIFNLAGRYCMKRGSSACIGLRCMSKYYDIWSF